MFEHLKGKKLLYLGGIRRAAYVVKRARSLGIYVIVADYNEDSPAKAVANEGVLVDAMDVEALVSLGKEKRIDGIMTGYADILLPICLKVAGRLNLHCYFTENMINASTDKKAFKKMCADNCVPIPETYSYESVSSDVDYKSLPYPVFIKPLDASGSRGADVCYGPEEFCEKLNYAFGFSKQKQVTVEEFLTGQEFILDYFVINGTPYMLSMADRYTIDGRGAAINSPNLMILPSKNLKQYDAYVNEKVKEMFVKEGFRDGLLFLQGYITDKKIAFYEMGCRLGGTWPYIDEYFHRVNPMDMLFEHALSGEISVRDGEGVSITPFFNGKAAIIYFLSNVPEGEIGFIEGVGEVESYPWVVDVMQFYDVGDRFDMERQTDVRFLSVHLVADDFETLKERIKTVYEKIKVEDKDHNDLLSAQYDVDKLCGYN